MSPIIISLLFIGVIVSLYICIKRKKAKYEKFAVDFINEVRNIISGNISTTSSFDRGILDVSLRCTIRLNSRYKDREVQCEYLKPIYFGQRFHLPDIVFKLKPLRIPKSKGVKLPYHKITDKVEFIEGYLVYKPLSVKDFIEVPQQQYIFNILDELFRAAEILENKPEAKPVE